MIDESLLNTVAELHKKESNAYNPETDISVEEIKTEINEIMNDNGYTRVSGGTYRTVYKKNDEQVVKFAGGREAQKENNSEVRNWNRTEDVQVKDPFSSGAYCDARRFLATILSYQQSRYTDWIVMECIDDGENTVSADEANKIESTLSDAGIHIDELYPANIGRKEDRPVIFDYGGK